MEERKWKRVEYDTWDDAFKALVPQLRQQSVRVASYARELFVQACAMSFARNTAQGQERIHGRYADVIYKCGMYHQLGKALVPPEYQLWQPDFTEEEQQLFRKYTTDGRTLVSVLQVRGAKSRFWKKEQFAEQPTDNIPWLMIRECCEQHMERWDGSGYPAGRKGQEISAPAQIVGLAKELDMLVSETKSEDPFNEAMDRLIGQSGTLWNPDLIKVLEAAREQCYEVYQKYIHYTLTLPKTLTLVERRPDRVMGLSYRPIHGALGNSPVAYEATPWFGGIVGRPGEVERLQDLAPLLRTTGLTSDVAFYFLYEAADTILRMHNCKLDINTLVVQMPDDFYLQGGRLKGFNQLFEDQPIEKNSLWLTISEEVAKNANKSVTEVIARYTRNGIVLVMDNFHPDTWETERLKEFGIQYYRLSPEVYNQPETADSIAMLKTWGFHLMASDVDSEENRAWLVENGVEFICGPITGAIVTEDEMIRDGIVRQSK